MKFFLVKCDDDPLALSMMHPEEKAGWRQARRADCFPHWKVFFHKRNYHLADCLECLELSVMSSHDDERTERIARSAALKNQARNEQQAAVFLCEVAKIRCQTARDDLPRTTDLVRLSTELRDESRELRRRLSRKAG